MLGQNDAVATLGVSDLEAAADFYEHTLGLRVLPSEEAEVKMYQAGSTKLLVYRSQFAGTNRATAVTWPTPDVDGLVRQLAANGVKFERYEIPGMTHEGDVHVSATRRSAWFIDPSGNIHAIVNS